MTATDPRESLKEIAARARVKTRPANLSIRLVKDNFEIRCGFKLDGLKCDVYANPSLLHVDLHRDSGLLFSTPNRSSILSTGLLLGQVAGQDVYVNAQGLGSPVPWIYSAEAVAALGALALESDELLTVAMNGPYALFRSAGGDADWQRIQKLVALARILPPAPAEGPLDPGKLSAELRALVPPLMRWGISDDSERSDLVTGAKTAQLRALVERVEPLMPRIAKFLDEHGQEDLAEASALDALAQSVMEARQELTSRSESIQPPG